MCCGKSCVGESERYYYRYGYDNILLVTKIIITMTIAIFSLYFSANWKLIIYCEAVEIASKSKIQRYKGQFKDFHRLKNQILM